MWHDPGCVEFCDGYISNDQVASLVMVFGGIASGLTSVGVAIRKLVTGPSDNKQPRRFFDRLGF